MEPAKIEYAEIGVYTIVVLLLPVEYTKIAF